MNMIFPALLPSPSQQASTSTMTQQLLQTPLTSTACHSETNTHERGDLGMHGLFERGTTAIVNGIITNLDSISIRSQDPEKVLLNQEAQIPTHL
jgi:hypothetical protein